MLLVILSGIGEIFLSLSRQFVDFISPICTQGHVVAEFIQGKRQWSVIHEAQNMGLAKRSEGKRSQWKFTAANYSDLRKTQWSITATTYFSYFYIKILWNNNIQCFSVQKKHSINMNKGMWIICVLPCGCMEQYLHKLTQKVIFGSEYTPVKILTCSWGSRNTYVPVKWVIKKKKCQSQVPNLIRQL